MRPPRLVDFLLNFVEDVPHPELFRVVHDVVQDFTTTFGCLGVAPVQLQIFIICVIFLESDLR